MNAHTRWSRALFIVGLLCMLVGAIDPLEGSLLILPGSVLVALAAFLGKSRHRKLLYLSLILVAVGVGALWVLSAFGGIGRPGQNNGHSMWWGVFMLPYPVGVIMGLIGAIRGLVEAFKRPEQPGQKV